MTAFSYDIGQLPREKDNFFSLENSKTLLKIINKSVEIKNANVASGDSFITNINYVNYVMFKKEKIDVIDMESWSVANVCNKIKLILFLLK